MEGQGQMCKCYSVWRGSQWALLGRRGVMGYSAPGVTNNRLSGEKRKSREEIQSRYFNQEMTVAVEMLIL